MSLDLKYKNANESDSFKIQNEFLNLLLNDISENGMEIHYEYFQNSVNSDLKRILGKGFIKRGDLGFEFLRRKIKSEVDIIKKSNIIHLLGLSSRKDTLPDILPFLNNSSYDLRYKAIISIGWLGDINMISILINHYANEKDLLLKGFVITAMRQIYFRHNEVKNETLSFILSKLKDETHLDLIAIMIVVIQDLSKIKYGLKEDSNTGEISGEILKVKAKIIKKISL